MTYDIKQVQEFYDLACINCNENQAWLFEGKFAEVVTNYCAQIVQDCSDLRIPLSEVPNIVRSGKSPLADERFFNE